MGNGVWGMGESQQFIAGQGSPYPAMVLCILCNVGVISGGFAGVFERFLGCFCGEFYSYSLI
jgi:hypothetical protein